MYLRRVSRKIVQIVANNELRGTTDLALKRDKEKERLDVPGRSFCNATEFTTNHVALEEAGAAETSPTLYRAKRRMDMFSPSLATACVIISPMVTLSSLM